ncbi:MAG: hypothetical protein E7564_02145 [Ruminococcaceae bacterium]|nr:hypothetical protein [Oscillospiraceae bacterium]
MKKFLSVILVLIMCLSFTACGNNEETSQEANEGSISESSSSSVSEESSLGAESSEETSDIASKPDDSTIEITLDNWQDYFELDYEFEVKYKEDGVTIDRYLLHPAIVFKEGCDYVVPGEEDTVELIFDAKYEFRYVFLNKNDLTYEIGGICDTHEPDPDTTLEATLYYDDFVDIEDYEGKAYWWLEGTVTHSTSYTENTSGIPDEELFYKFSKEEDGVQKYKIPVIQLPVITCIEAKGKLADR